MKGSSATSQKSVQDAKKRLQKFLKTIETVPSQIMEAEARRIEGEAKREAPFRTGKLEGSVKGRVSKSKSRPGFNISASARSKGYNYAGIQHENTKFIHPIKGKAHFLRDPFNRGVKRLKATLRKRLKPPGGS